MRSKLSTAVVLTCLGAGSTAAAAAPPIRVTVWDEQQAEQKRAYDTFLGNAIADHLKGLAGLEVRSVRQDDPDQGLPDPVLESTDVLIWWGHTKQGKVKEELAKRIALRVKAGKLALVALHSAHWSRPFVQAMEDVAVEQALARIPAAQRSRVHITFERPAGQSVPKRGDTLTPEVTITTEPDGTMSMTIKTPACIFPSCCKDNGRPSHIRTLLRDHPLARNIPATFDIPATEMYDEPFHVPPPDALVFDERWDAGEHFRSGMVWKLGKGLVFYFRPGHESYPIYKQDLPLRIVENAVRWMGGEVRRPRKR